MSEFVSPLSLSADQRKANMSALNARMMRATAKVAADKSQSRKVRDAAKRDNAAARRIAKTI
jgi:hypothetical protein